MASRASPLLEVTFHRSLLRTLIEHSVVYSAENPSRATQIGRSDACQHERRPRVGGWRPGACEAQAIPEPRRHAQTLRCPGAQGSSKTSLDQHGYYSGVRSFGTLTKISKRGKSPGIQDNVATLAERNGRGAPDFPRFNQAEPMRSAAASTA